MGDYSATPSERFFEEDSNRGESRQLDYGFFQLEDGGRGSMVTWFETTNEVCALIGSGSKPQAFILLGTAPSYRSLEAVLADRPEPSTSIVWVAEQLKNMPRDPDALGDLVSTYEERLLIEAEDIERRHLASFEVMALAELPETEEEEAERWSMANWPSIAQIAVELWEAGVSARDQESIVERGSRDLGPEDCGLLWSLFYDPIAIPTENTAFINGRHRTAAMRAAGVIRCVVHTDKGFG